jgi:hypothetical protein
MTNMLVFVSKYTKSNHSNLPYVRLRFLSLQLPDCYSGCLGNEDSLKMPCDIAGLCLDLTVSDLHMTTIHFREHPIMTDFGATSMQTQRHVSVTQMTDVLCHNPIAMTATYTDDRLLASRCDELTFISITRRMEVL